MGFRWPILWAVTGVWVPASARMIQPGTEVDPIGWTGLSHN